MPVLQLGEGGPAENVQEDGPEEGEGDEDAPISVPMSDFGLNLSDSD